MTGDRRRLMFQVMREDQRIPPYLYQINKYSRCDEILVWLIGQSLTGPEFIGWLKEAHSGSLHQACAYVISKLPHPQQSNVHILRPKS